MKLSAGDKAPNFTLPDQNGEMHSLEDMRGMWALLFFYPRDNTPGCTKEACSMRDAQPDFAKLDATVIGISTDSVKSHKKFEEKHKLNMILLADESKEVVEAYGVWGKKKFLGREYTGTNRMSFLINPEGVIAKVYEKVMPAIHAQEVVEDLKALGATS